MDPTNRTLWWDDGEVVMVDQRLLPHEFRHNRYSTPDQVASAIREMVVRGAPAIGAAAALGMALQAHHSDADEKDELMMQLREKGEVIKGARPTAVNLSWAVDHMVQFAESADVPLEGLKSSVVREARRIADEDAEINRRLTELGADLIEDGEQVMTHCNAGPLATVAHGTAQGAIIQAHREGKDIAAYACETRPRMQGARITMFEFGQAGVPATLIADTAAGLTMARKDITKVLVGADRILADGTTFNKIGTYQLAVLAKRHRIPFYVLAPYSTIDFTSEASEITIEERPPTEVTDVGEVRVAPEGVDVYNPAFDETPPELIEGIVTERGVIRPPFSENIPRLYEDKVLA